MPAPSTSQDAPAAANASREVMIRAENLGKRFKIYKKPTDRLLEWATAGRRKTHTDFWAVRGVTFEVPRGSCLGVIGANGSGKSTLLKMMTGALYPTEGSFRVTGRVLSLIELGTGLNPMLSGRANIVHMARLLGFPVEYAREKMQEIEAFADIGEFFEREVRVYSTGMRVRLAFAMFACFRPEVFIVDEALSVGDVFFQQKCAARLREQLDAGMTMLFVSHDQAAILNLCDHAIQLEHGRVVFEGAPHETIQRYAASLQKRPKFGKARQSQPAAPPARAPAESSGNGPEEILRHSVLPEIPDRFGAQNALVRAVRITDARGADTLRGFMGETVTVQVLIEAVNDVQEPGAGLHVVDRFNNIVFACGTRSMDVKLPDLAAGESIVVRFDLTLDVRPDSYTLEVGTSVPSADSAEGGFVNDRVQNLGPLLVMQDRNRIRPFFGIARLPLKISAGAPIRCGATA